MLPGGTATMGDATDARCNVEPMQGSTSETGSDRYLIQLKAYKRVADAVQTPVMVSIKAHPRTAEQREPVDIVLVLHVHVRCMAPANWHILVNEATKHIVDKLGDNDRLAIVPSLSKETRIIFEDAVVVPVKPKLLPMSSDNKKTALNSVESSEAMRSNTPLLRDLESAESILFGRESKDEKERFSYIIVISNSNEDLSSMLTWRFRSIKAFGFRDANNARTMYTIANGGGGTYAILDDKDELTQAFRDNINMITTAVEPLEVHLKCNEEVIISTIQAPRICYFISFDKKTGIIWSNTPCGLTANFVIYLDIPAHYDDTEEYSNLLNIQVKFVHPPFSAKGPSLVPVSKCKDGSKEVAAEMMRMEAVKIVSEIAAADKEGSEELYAAAQKLHDQWIRVRDSVYGREAAEAGLTDCIVAEMEEMEERLYTNEFWLDYMLSWLSLQWCPWPRHVRGDIHSATWTRRQEHTKSPEDMSSMDKGQDENTDAISQHTSFENMSTSDKEQEELTSTKSRPIGHEPMQETSSHPLLQLRAMVKVDAFPMQMQMSQRGVPMLVHILVLPVEGLQEKRAPIDLVAVLDVSCAAKEMKMRRMKLLDKAIEFTMEKLTQVDRLAIILVQSTMTEQGIGLKEMTNKRKDDYKTIVSDLASTSMDTEQASNDGMHLLEMPMCIPITTVKASGTHVHCSNNLSKSMRHAVKLLDQRQAAGKEDRLGFIMLISDRQDISIQKRTLRSKYTIHAFGFHGANNARAMHHIAANGSSSGVYALLYNRNDEITAAFKSTITKITSIIAVNTRVNILCTDNSNLRLSHVESGRFKSTLDRLRKSVSISAGAIYPGASRRYIAYLENVRDERHYNSSTMLKVNMTWRHATTNDNDRVAEEETLQSRVITVRGRQSSEVVQEMVRVEGMRIVRSITDPETEIDTVLERVQELRKLLRVRASYVGVRQRQANVAASSSVVDVDGGGSLASLVTATDEDPVSHMLSWLSFEGLCEKLPSGTG